ncbi:MAG: hypothetical protein O2899_01540 [Bacteroidetes bacterium]|nr:hypothetical protein [Bacteroidota bacterium]
MIRHVFLFLLLGLAGTPTLAQDFRPPELNVQFHRARTAWTSGNSLLEAKARIDRVLEALPEDVEALKLRAAILLDLNRPEVALEDANRAAGLAPENGEAHLLRCEAASRLGTLSEAEQALQLASNLFLQRIDHYVRLSACALAIGAATRAESLARVAVAQNDGDPRGHIQLARVFMATERSEAARAVVDRMMASSMVSRQAVMADSQLARLYGETALDQD